MRSLREGQEKLRENQEALRIDVNKLWEENRRINENIEKLWQENNKLWREVRLLRRDVGAIRRTLDNLTASIEEEANDVITHLLRGGRGGVDIRTDRIVLDSRFEFDVYGTNGQLTIVGEAKTRVGPRLIARIDERVSEALRLFPDKFPGRVIKVIYCIRQCRERSRRLRGGGYLAYREYEGEDQPRPLIPPPLSSSIFWLLNGLIGHS
ncbi:hypothetical protein [Vulcanisaeta souniana]|uniref:hypothetical protein n=1 Tax=Vulcanisaeta souniana TaxID=164452 RepID=UPI0006D1F964|nr:hypothetical protein [Vulcanisaeta souniana]